MRKLALILLFAAFGLSTATARTSTIDSLGTTLRKPLTQLQRDSLLTTIGDDLHSLTRDANYLESLIGRYKIYPTNNIYNSLMLDTSTGRVTAVQIGINNDNSRFQYKVCDAVETNYELAIVGRFELYPTGNNYNFILLDTLWGYTYQVQWSTDNNCGIWRIW